MYSQTIVNAAPMTLHRGTRDVSVPPYVLEDEPRPTHLPYVPVWAKKGPRGRQLVSGAARSQIYHSDSFDLRKKWANGSTLLSNVFASEGNIQMIERLIPPDAGPEANIIVWLDVLPTTVVDYQRNSDGSYTQDPITLAPMPVLDAVTGLPTTIAGYKVKFVSTFHPTDISLQNFGMLTITAGDQVDAVTGVTSQRYPIFEFKNSSIGEDGNLDGIRIWSPALNSPGSIDLRILTEGKIYPYRMSVVRKNEKTKTTKVTETLYGEQMVNVSFKKDSVHPATDGSLFAEEIFLDQYQNVKDRRYIPQVGAFSDFKVYTNNINTLVAMFAQAEKNYITSNLSTPTDFAFEADEEHLFNFVGGTTSTNYPYHTYQFVTGGITLNQYTNIMAKGGSDGTMTEAMFANLLIDKMEEYNNPNSALMDMGWNVESIVYDYGLPLAAKYALLNMIAIRKDTFVWLCTHEDNQLQLTAQQEHSLAISLRTRAEFFPESDYFGTPVMRCSIMGRSGYIRDQNWNRPFSFIYEVAKKSARYMGASNGKWKTGYHFGGFPHSKIEWMTQPNVGFTNDSARNRDWDAGLNWVQTYDRRSFFIPALQTVYNEDRSVLNNYVTAMAIVEINKLTKQIWKEFSGVDNLSRAQLKDRIEARFNVLVKDKFDGRFVLIPEVKFTEADIARGYSWHLIVKIGAEVPDTVMTTYVEAYRKEDLEQILAQSNN